MLSRHEALAELNRSLRGAVMPDPGTILFAGEQAFEAWYTRADRRAVRRRRRRGRPDTADFQAWLRGVDDMSGETLCGCTLAGAGAGAGGVLALAVASDGQLFIGGFRQTTQAELWLARAPAASCPLDCTPELVVSDPGKSSFTAFKYAEHVPDAVLALHPLASGGVVAGGTLDGDPWLARYTNNGQPLPWTMRPSAMAPTGAVLAIAVGRRRLRHRRGQRELPYRYTGAQVVGPPPPARVAARRASESLLSDVGLGL